MTTLPIHETDVAIIGAGPSGLFAVFECGMLGMSCAVVDALPHVGGQCVALYPEKPIYDIPGFPSVGAEELISRLESQMKPFDPKLLLNQTVVSLSKEIGKWRLSTSSGQEIVASALIIAAGSGAFGPNRPPVDDIQSYENTSVFYMVRRKADFAGKNIVIAGGGDSAVDWALSLHDVAKSIYLVHRRDKFRAAPESVAQLKALANAGKLSLKVPYQLDGIDGNAPHLTGVRIRSEEGAVDVIAADILLPFYGLSPDLGVISTWGLNINHHTIPVDPSTCQTVTPGIYAIGDIVNYKDKLKLILTGFAEAAQAAHAIYHYIHPEKPLHMAHSTDKGVPGLSAASAE
jgi:thioredoxin reductase (NADPH)